MFDHAEIHTADMTKSAGFYRDVLTALGYRQVADADMKSFTDEDGKMIFILPGDPEPVHLAFRAADQAAVRRVLALAEASGHCIEKEPRFLTSIHPKYYALSLRDPDGRLIEIVSHS